jgi:hypothetical protein
MFAHQNAGNFSGNAADNHLAGVNHVPISLDVFPRRNYSAHGQTISLQSLQDFQNSRLKPVGQKRSGTLSTDDTHPASADVALHTSPQSFLNNTLPCHHPVTTLENNL